MRDCLARSWERKRTLLVFLALFLAGFVLGICFVKEPAFYEYHLSACERYLSRVCYSDRSVFTIFLERTAGCALLLLLVLIAGVHVAALAVPPVVLLYRAYTFGGSVAVFLGVYSVSGFFVVFALYLPMHLLIDAVLIAGTAVSFGRAPRFCFSKGDFAELALDFLALLILVAIVCFFEMFLLLAVFHPVGYVI